MTPIYTSLRQWSRFFLVLGTHTLFIFTRHIIIIHSKDFNVMLTKNKVTSKGIEPNYET
jgi:hypothetical protein